MKSKNCVDVTFGSIPRKNDEGGTSSSSFLIKPIDCCTRERRRKISPPPTKPVFSRVLQDFKRSGVAGINLAATGLKGGGGGGGEVRPRRKALVQASSLCHLRHEF